ncbi:MAG: alkaline phosphatase family protein, partial [Nitrososphaerales archaeon]
MLKQKRGPSRRKVILIGLDSAPPELLLERFLDKMPTIRRLVKNGISGRMRSCDPPITVPAWMVMMTGMDPGQLGIYGFRNRKGWSYSDYYLTTSTMIKEKPIWEIIAQTGGMKSCLIGVPPSYPVRPIMGNLISCFLTPGLEKEYTYPHELRDEVAEIVGEYEFDAAFRSDNRDEILEAIRRMTNKRFDLANYMIEQKEWSFFMLVEIGLDRLHHTFWKYFDDTHPRFESGNRFEMVLEDYYILLDKRIGELIESGGEDTIIIIASDHGSKAMKGAFCINEWLIREGYLKLAERPEGIVSIEDASVDWDKTKVWGWGGYYS